MTSAVFSGKSGGVSQTTMRWSMTSSTHGCHIHIGELKNVLQICFSGLLRSPYEITFWDQGATVLSEMEAVSSFNFVRGWLSRGFSGRDRRLMSGLLCHCESTDLQVSRLHDLERCHTWDQLLKKGLAETHNVCERMLSGEPPPVVTAHVDEYRSNVCAQLESLEKTLLSPRPAGKGVPKFSRMKSPRNLGVHKRRDADDVTTSSRLSVPKLQSAVAIVPKSPTTSQSKGVSSRFSPAMRNRGRRTGGKPAKSGRRRYMVFDSSDSDSDRGRASPSAYYSVFVQETEVEYKPVEKSDR